jgi:hypothetical protein
MLRKSILVKNQEMVSLLSLVNRYYASDNKNSIQEVNLDHVANRISDDIIRDHIVNCWYNLEQKVGQAINLLENNYKKSIINRLYKKSRDLSFVIKTRANQVDTHESIKKASNISVIVKEFSL